MGGRKEDQGEEEDMITKTRVIIPERFGEATLLAGRQRRNHRPETAGSF